MATITRLSRNSGVRYKAIIKYRGRVVKTKTFSSKNAARAWAKRIESDQEMIRALGVPGYRITFAQLAEEYLAQWRGKDKAVPSKVRQWVELLGDRTLTDIEPHEIQSALEKYGNGNVIHGVGVGRTMETKKKRAPGTYNRWRAQISVMFSFAIKRRYVTANPVRLVPALPEAKGRVRWLSDEERERLLKACKRSDWPKLHLLVVLAITTGARLGELLNLRWSHIDLEAKTAYLEDTKNGEGRMLTLPSPAINELKQYQGDGGGLVFPSDRMPDRPFHFRKHWDQALLAAVLEGFRFHDLRHTAASYLVMNGATLYEVGEVLGHKTLDTTKRYAHLSTHHKAQLTERVFSKIMGGKGARR